MKLRRELTSQRELVRRLQLQSFFRQSDGPDLHAAALLDRDFQKRSIEGDVSLPSLSREERFDQFFNIQEQNERLMKQRKRSAEGQDSLPEGQENAPAQEETSESRNKIFVPFTENKSVQGRSNVPCRRKRSSDENVTDRISKRHLNTPPGEGLVPQYNMYDELCEDSQPVKVVKIKTLVIKDGVIRDNDISETLLS